MLRQLQLVKAVAWLCALGCLIGAASSSDLDEDILKLIEGGDPTPRIELPASPSKSPRSPGAATRDASAASGVLTLTEAERMAQESDPLVKAWQEKSAALEQQATAALRLADPKLRIGINEYPWRSTDNGNDAYRVVVGIQQAVMPQVRREHESAQMELMGQAQESRADNQKLVAVRELRKAWLNVFLQHHTVVILRQTQKLVAQVQQIIQGQYRSGGSSQNAVIQMQVELSLLKDRESQVETARETALAELMKWAGPALAGRTLSLDTVELPAVAERSRLEQNLDQHPALQAMKLESDSANEAVEVARARAKPEWMFELEAMWMNSKESGLQSDSLSAYVVVDLPFFKKNLQDRWLAAGEKDYNAALFLAADERRDLKRMLDQDAANIRRLDERLAFYRDVILPQVAQNAQVAMRAYQSQAAEFNDVMRARQMELDSKLEALRMLVDRDMAKVNLLYLSGGGS